MKKAKELEESKLFLKHTHKFGGLTLLDFKTYYKALVIKIVVLAKGQTDSSQEQTREYG